MAQQTAKPKKQKRQLRISDVNLKDMRYLLLTTSLVAVTIGVTSFAFILPGKYSVYNLMNNRSAALTAQTNKYSIELKRDIASANKREIDSKLSNISNLNSFTSITEFIGYADIKAKEAGVILSAPKILTEDKLSDMVYTVKFDDYDKLLKFFRSLYVQKVALFDNFYMTENSVEFTVSFSKKTAPQNPAGTGATQTTPQTTPGQTTPTTGQPAQTPVTAPSGGGELQPGTTAPNGVYVPGS